MGKVKRVLTIVPTRPLLYTTDAAGVVHWQTEEGRQWLWDEGILYFYRGNSFHPMCEAFSQEAAMMWSLGFSAGRDLPLALREVPWKK